MPTAEFMNVIEEMRIDAAPEAWGIFTYSDLAAPLGGGTGGFYWFGTREDLMAFCRELLAKECCEETTALTAKVAAIIDSHVEGSTSADAAIKAIDKLLKGHRRVPWWGQYDELRTSDHPFARRVREFVNDSPDPLDEEDFADLTDSIAMYGV